MGRTIGSHLRFLTSLSLSLRRVCFFLSKKSVKNELKYKAISQAMSRNCIWILTNMI